MTRRDPPRGRLTPDFDGLQAAGCIQCESDNLREMFAGLYTAMAGNPCDGCPVWDDIGEGCKAFQKFHSDFKAAALARDRRIVEATGPCQKNGKAWEGYSVAEIAKELGISKNEVRRRKLAGTLPEPRT